jgi:hypothetical protein
MAYLNGDDFQEFVTSQLAKLIGGKAYHENFAKILKNGVLQGLGN